VLPYAPPMQRISSDFSEGNFVSFKNNFSGGLFSQSLPVLPFSSFPAIYLFVMFTSLYFSFMALNVECFPFMLAVVVWCSGSALVSITVAAGHARPELNLDLKPRATTLTTILSSRSKITGCYFLAVDQCCCLCL